MVHNARDWRPKAWFETRVKQRVDQWYKHLILETLLRQNSLPSSKDGRHVPLSPAYEIPLVDERSGHAYISNHVRSSRYTIFDFLPKQIFFQITRLSNFYFICIGIPQAIPGFSTTGNFTTILPVLFFILITVLKEAYDDYKRHRLDNVENTSKTVGLRKKEHGPQKKRATYSIELKQMSWPLKKQYKESVSEGADEDEDDTLEWTTLLWQDIRVGEVIKIKRDDPMPADVVLLYADGENGQAYVETMDLDGETNLKSRQAPHELQGCRTIQGVKSCDASFVFEDPNPNLYDFNGRLTVNGKTSPLTLNEVIYRGSILRNTSFAIGMVINTGEECKIRMNANHHPQAKKPRLERYANHVVLTLIAYVIILSGGLTLGYYLWHNSTERKSWYLNHAYVPYKQIIIGYLIMFNNVIPLALYVSLEIVKVGQAIMLNSDINLYDEASNTPMTCNTNTILENLGQVSYVLTDKTGTLTENDMKFRKMSIAGTAWLHNPGAPVKKQVVTGKSATEYGSRNQSKGGIRIEETEVSASSSGTDSRASTAFPASTEPTTAELLDYIRSNENTPFARAARELLLGMALCHTCLPETSKDGSIDFQASSPDELAIIRAAQELGYSLVHRSALSITLLVSDPNGKSSRQIYNILDIIEFSSKRKRMSVVLQCPNGQIWLLCKGADSVVVPLLRQAVLAKSKANEVRASIEHERHLQRRSGQFEDRTSLGQRPSSTYWRASSLETQRRISLDVLRLSQAPHYGPRSRESGETRRFDVKTSHHVPDEATVFTRCFKHLDDFATEGLRTLVFAHKFIAPSEYATWKKSYLDATTSLSNRQDRIEEAAELIEQSLVLLGASAIEDKLQKGVPETITKLRRANIRIWMLTGDKRETAINIAHSAQICRPDSSTFVLDSSKGNLESQIRDVLLEIHQESPHNVVVIDGHTLAQVESDLALRNLFYSLVPLIDSAICCRASPAQKAGIVEELRARIPEALTLAIGDGANDIAMIQTAHVGIGISGKEGLQAARVADFSIAQFRFLQRLLLVHGRWNYARTAKFVLMTFWKEFFFYMMQAMYLRYTGYTGTSLYESSSLTVLNTLFTSLCVIIMGIFEQDLRAETLLAIPELYVYGQKNLGLNLPDYILWIIGATAQGMIVWLVAWAAYGFNNAMGDNGLFAFGDLIFSLGIIWTNWKLL